MILCAVGIAQKKTKRSLHGTSLCRNRFSLSACANVGALRELYDFGNIAEGEARHGVSTTIIDGYATSLGVVQGGTGETDVGHVAHALVELARRDEVGTRAGDDAPRLIKVEQCRAESVDIAVARMQHAVMEDKPTLTGLDGRGTCADLHALPRAHLEGSGRHHMAMVSPELHVGRLAVEDISKGRMPRVARAAEHSIASPTPALPRREGVNLSWEEHAVAIVRQESVLHLMERLEVLSPSHADGRSVVAVAPGHPPTVIDAANAWVVAIDPLADFLVIALELQRFLVDVPIQSVVAEANMKRHAAVGVVAAEYAGKAFAEGNDSTVENTVRRRKQVATDDGILTIAPQGSLAACRPLLPWHVGQWLPLDGYVHSVQCSKAAVKGVALRRFKWFNAPVGAVQCSRAAVQGVYALRGKM